MRSLGNGVINIVCERRRPAREIDHPVDPHGSAAGIAIVDEQRLMPELVGDLADQFVFRVLVSMRFPDELKAVVMSNWS